MVVGMDRYVTADDLYRAVEGDSAAFARVCALPHAHLLAARRDLAVLTLTTSAVWRVLRALQQHTLTPSQAQAWASFVRRGYVAGQSVGPIQPLTIAYADADEDVIADAIARLDELGDTIDGMLTPTDLTDHMARLQPDVGAAEA